jgi:hypothetical protein
MVALAMLMGSILAMPVVSAGALPSTCGGRVDRGELRVIGLTADQSLICFGVKDPDDATTIGSITGFSVDTSLVGIDFRPATGDLYGLGNAGGVYILNTDDASAALQARLNMPLSGTNFEVDFNPTVDRLRIVSDTGQNLRANVVDGVTAMDSSLNYVGPPAVNPAPGVTGAAYTNNDADPSTATTLYDIDSNLDQVVIQAPPNAGPLSATGKLTVDTGPQVGFDIYSVVRKGTTVSVKAFASLTTAKGSAFYRINLVTGKASLRGAFETPVIGIALPLDQGSPSPA